MAPVRAAAVSATVIALAALGLAAPAAAHAATRSVEVGVSAPSALTLLQRGTGQPAAADDFRSFDVGLDVMSDEDMSDDLVTGVTLTGDARSLVGVAELQLPKQCSWTDAAHTRFSCDAGSLDVLGADLGFKIRANATAAENATGSIVFHPTGKGISEDSTGLSNDTTKIVIGHGADLSVKQLDPLYVPAGAKTVSPDVEVTNQGDQDASGIVFVLAAEGDSIALQGNYGNCTYGTEDGVVCRFPDLVIHPGETYTVQPGTRLTVDPLKANGLFGYGFDVTGGEIDKSLSPRGHQGTGPALTLVPVGTARTPNAADIDYSNNISLTAVVGTGYDLAAVGRSVHGTVGRTVDFSATVHNAGKLAMKNGVIALVGLPKGVQVTKAPKSCEYGGDSYPTDPLAANGLEDDAPMTAGSLYFCFDQSTLKAGSSLALPFTVKFTKALGGAKGLVLAAGTKLEADMKNNVATLSFTATQAAPAAAQSSAPASPTASAAASATAAAATSSAAAASGGLANTGGGSLTLPITLISLGSVVVGAGLVSLATRRRRAH